MKYLVSHESHQSGPFSMEEIVAKVRAKELELFDYIYDLEKDDWVLLMEFAPLAQKLKSNKPARPPGAIATATGSSIGGPKGTVGTGTTKAGPLKASEEITEEITQISQNPISDEITQVTSNPISTVATEKVAPVTVIMISPSNGSVPVKATAAPTGTEWFVLKGENRFGPFNATDLIRMQQQKVVFPFDFVWHAGMESWKRVAEIPNFDTQSIRKLLTAPEMDEVFIPRRFERIKYSGQVIIHDGASLWRGQGIEISKGGVGVTMQNTRVLPGQQLTVHFTQQGDWPAFNAVCEVVSKKFVSDSTPVEYGLRFLSMSRETQDEFYKKVT